MLFIPVFGVSVVSTTVVGRYDVSSQGLLLMMKSELTNNVKQTITSTVFILRQCSYCTPRL